jgi:hypothetical protein
MIRTAILAATFAGTIVTAALANSLVAPGPRSKIARSSFSASPDSEWNRLSAREGRNVETWTIDGPQLNKVNFFGGIEVGKPLFREADRRNQPLPRVTPNMLITDIPMLLESSYRVQFGVTRMSIDSQLPETVGGHQGIRFTYSFVRQDDEVERRGEAVGAVVGERLFMVTYEAPAIHFFDKDLERFRQLAGTLRM